MSDIRKKAEEIMMRGDEMIAMQKRRRKTILRSCAIGAGAAAVLGVGLTTYALRPPKKPASSQSGIIVETETTSAETTVAPTSPSTTATQTTSTKQVTTTTVSTTASTSSARMATTTAPTTSRASRTTATAANTTAALSTQPPTITSVATTTKDIEERIANIVMQMPDIMPIVQELPAVNENGERIPTFPMLLADDRYYLLILRYDKGELDFTADFNDDGKVDLCDALELELYKYCYEYKKGWKEYPRDFDNLFPDTDVFNRVDNYSSQMFGSRDKYFLTYYLIYNSVDIPNAECIEEIARKYAESRPIPESVFTSLSKDVGGIIDDFNALYEKYYKKLNEDSIFSDYELSIFEKIDSGELFPDADRDGYIGYMDCYTMLRFYAYMSTGNNSDNFTNSDVEWILGHCDIDDWNYVNAKDVGHLLTYLFYYKKEDYVTQIEMEMEYKSSHENKAPAISITPTNQ